VNTHSDAEQRLVASYRDLRALVGLLGMLLPIALPSVACLVDGRSPLLSSVSAYYGTGSRDVLVGVLFVFSAFFVEYRGYDRIDECAGNAGALFAMVVAVCPCTSRNQVVATLHLVAAALLFLTFAFFCLFRFTKRDPGRVAVTRRKQLRDSIYKVNGGVIVAGMIAIALHGLFRDKSQPASTFTFFVESLMLWAFGFAWIVKGNALLADESPENVAPSPVHNVAVVR
jgi:hypothetical protein